jgi:O6-methylguanine-DNA--protein-cysteine methyltransferase
VDGTVTSAPPVEIVHTARVDTPIGALRLASTSVGLAFLELPHSNGNGLRGLAAALGARRARRAGLRAEPGPRRSSCVEYLEGKRRDFELALDLRGTEFQLAVWRALCAIPYGETISYASRRGASAARTRRARSVPRTARTRSRSSCRATAS